MNQDLGNNSQKHQSNSPLKTIPDWLKDGANIYGQAIAISDTERSLSLSYQGLFEQTQTVATQLYSLGLKPGDVVVIALDNGADFLTSILSVASIATAFPLNPHQPETEYNRYFSQLKVKAVIVACDSLSAICSVASASNIPVWELNSHSQATAGQFSLSTSYPHTKQTNTQTKVAPKLDDYAVLVGTSGATGLPKIISVTHESFFVSISHAADWMELRESDRSLVLTPLAWLHALVRSSCPLLLRGGEVVCTPGYNPAKILNWLDSYQPSFFTGVPSIYRSILQQIDQTNWTPAKSLLRFLVTGSDKIAPSEIQAVESVFGVPLIQFYGMSEVSPLPVVRPFPPTTTPSKAIGKVNPLWQIAFLDEDGSILNSGKEGEILLRGSYINQLVGSRDDRTENKDDGWFHTGDLGYLDDANFLYYTGRVDNRINRGGKKIYAGEVEAVLLTHLEVSAAVAFGIPDTLYGECIAAVVVLHLDSTATSASIRQYVAERIADFKVPNRILIEDALPLNQFGKVKRKTLAKHYGLRDLSTQRSHLLLETNYIAPQTKIEQQLAVIWTKVLGLSQVGINDSFWDLGGNSLLALELIDCIEIEFGRVLPANTLFDAPTIARLSRLLTRSDIAKPWDCLVELRPRSNKPALFLVHDADGDTMLYLHLARNLKPDRPVYGLRPYGKEGFPILDWTMEQIVDRYVERILSVQPQGPYFVGGLCDGGVIAYEVGQQLQAKGHQVGFIALFDAIDLEAIRYKYAADVKKIEDRPKYELYRNLLSSGASLPQHLKNQISVRMMLRLAKEGYTPQKFTGKLLLFRATAKEFIPSETPQYLNIKDPLFGWQKRATEGVEVYDILDSHSGILREPSVKLLANQLEQAFAKSDCQRREDRNGPNSIESVEKSPQVEFKVSIVVLAHNSSELVIKTLESVIQQTFDFWEAIVVYNRNCDRLNQDLMSFAEKDPRIVLVPHSQTTNSAARNLGAKSAQHEWLLFIDAGDWLFPEHLEKLTTQLATAPEFDVVFCNWVLITAEGQETNSFAYNVDRFSELEEGLFNHLDICNQFPLHACLISKAVFNKASGFTTELATCEDWDLWQRIVALRGVFHTSIDLTLAVCLPKSKEVLANSQQLLHDGLQIIAREYKSDSRLKQPSNFPSSSRRKIGDAQFYWTGYCASRAIALGEDYLSLLNYLANQDGFATLSIDFELVYLDRAIVNGIRDAADTNSEDFPTLWQRIQPKVVHFLQELSQCSDIYFTTTPRIRSIETIILERIVQTRPLTLTQFHAVNCDLTQPISTQIPLENEILNCCIQLEEKVLGSINIPVFDGQVSSLVLADAIANRYVWKILDYFFKQTVYSQLTIKNTESGIVVKRGNFTLIEGLTPSPNLRHEILEKITWTIFLQELWGAIDWKQNDLSSSPKSQAMKIGDREWLIVELSNSLTDIVVSQDVLQVVVQIGGVSIGVIPVAVEDEILTAARLRTEIIEQAGFELARAAVREGLLGKPLNGELSLRERLSQAAKQKRDLNPLKAIVNNALPNTGNLLNQFLSPEENSLVIGYRQTQPIGTSASRWATLPTALIDELSECTNLHGESAISIDDSGRSRLQILYSPDLILPQISERNNTLVSNSNHHNIHLSGYTTELPILMYHQVSPLASDKPNRWHLSSELFEQQLHYLRDLGFYSITLEDWRKSIVTRQPLPGNALLITFDDGYQNFFTHAWPLLKEYGFSAMVFVIVDRIGTQSEGSQLMGWQEIKQLQQEGVQFGSHSLDHASFTDLSHVELVRQAINSRAILTKELGVPINAIAYPYGDCNSLVKDIVGACGYIFGLDTGFNRSTWQDSLLGLSRIEIENIDSLPRFEFKLG